MKIKNILFLSFISVGSIINAQNRKVGINTQTPTEILDVSETMRVRVLPDQGTTYTDVVGTSQVFAPVNPVVASSDGYNIVGKNTQAELVPNNKNTSFNTTNNSSAMFVVKRYSVGDWPSQATTTNPGIATGMDAAKWEAFMSNVGFTITKVEFLPNVFNELHLHSWTMNINAATASFPGGEWRIIGDINGVNEKSDFVDILFIKKGVVAADNRKPSFPFTGANPIP